MTQESVVGPAPVAIVTGGASGIGLAFAERWITSGNRVAVLDLDAATVERTATALGSDAIGIACDVTDAASVDAAIAATVERFGRIDTVFNSAGIARPAPSAEVTDADFSLMLDVHVTGTMRVCRAAYPHLRSVGGTIVNVASVAASMGLPGRASYTSAKAALGGLTRTLAVEWGPTGVRVNAIGPGYVRTEMTKTLIAEGTLADGPIRARTPLGRFAEPEEIADAAVFLATPVSSYVNGHLLAVDGGLSVEGDWYP